MILATSADPTRRSRGRHDRAGAVGFLQLMILAALVAITVGPLIRMSVAGYGTLVHSEALFEVSTLAESVLEEARTLRDLGRRAGSEIELGPDTRLGLDLPAEMVERLTLSGTLRIQTAPELTNPRTGRRDRALLRLEVTLRWREKDRPHAFVLACLARIPRGGLA